MYHEKKQNAQNGVAFRLLSVCLPYTRRRGLLRAVRFETLDHPERQPASLIKATTKTHIYPYRNINILYRRGEQLRFTLTRNNAYGKNETRNKEAQPSFSAMPLLFHIGIFDIFNALDAAVRRMLMLFLDLRSISRRRHNDGRMLSMMASGALIGWM